jgi:hypothetical protein
MKGLIPTESQIQITLLHYLRAKYPKLLVISLPNEGKRSLSEGKRLQKMGLTRGVPDLFIPKLKLFMELKRPLTGKLTPDQESMLAHLNDLGYHCKVAFGFDAAKDYIDRKMQNYR